jgi:hypothetical protein
MAIDFRSDPSPTPEGRGLARRAWDAYASTVRSGTRKALESPLVEPSIRRLASTMTVDLFGFYVAWHLHGGFEGLVELGMHPSTVWRKVKRFRTITGKHPDEFKMPGVTIDAAAYWDWARETGGKSVAERIRG